MDSVTATQRILKAQGRTTVWLARQIGLSQSHTYHLVAGQRPMKVDHRLRIATALGVPPEVLQDTREAAV